MPFSGSSTSPFPVRISVTSLSATIMSASRLRRYLSVRQSLASSTAARISWPEWRSSLASSRSNRVKASAVAPAKPPITLPSPSLRTLRALGFITVLPMETWPSPTITTLPSRRTERIVVPCQPILSSLIPVPHLMLRQRIWGGRCPLQLPSREEAYSTSVARPLKPCAITYHSDDSLRLAGGLACFTLVKLRLSSATSPESAPPASTLATKQPPGRSTSVANSPPASTSAIVRRWSVCWWPTVLAAMS